MDRSTRIEKFFVNIVRAFLGILLLLCSYSVEIYAEGPPIVTYAIDVRLDTEMHRLHGSEVICYTNRSQTSIPDLYFHLYLNAFKNDQSTFIRERGGAGFLADDGWGWAEIKRLMINGTDSLVDLVYMQPDDNNRQDQTVAGVPLPAPLQPGETVTVDLDFEAQLPKILARTGYHEDYYLVAQWFPKLGVWEPVGLRGRTEAGWNCHQFHANSEFYADFGDYDVSITVPADFIIGATGTEVGISEEEEGQRAIQFKAERVIDFTWTASPKFLKEERIFRLQEWVTEEELQHVITLHGISHEAAALPDVKMILLLQPEHRTQADRYFRALASAIKHFGLLYGPYPYPSITLVDPAWGAWGPGGMEYPRLITSHTSWLPPEDEFLMMGPEMVTVHEFGHQYWQTLVASNEFEDAWLDEGLTTYCTGLVIDTVYGPGRLYMPINFVSIPVDAWFPVAGVNEERLARVGVIANRNLDSIAREAWRFHDGRSYSMNSYQKTAAVLYQLQHELGDDMMARIMRTYFQRWHFNHPGPQDFIDVVEEIAGRDLDWFFDQLIFDTGSLDYAVEKVRSKRIRPGIGVFDTPEGRVTRTSDDNELDHNNDEEQKNTGKRYRNTVIIRNHGSVHYPVDILIRFKNGLNVREHWDGAYPWIEFEYVRSTEIEQVIIDPDEHLIIDTNRANNTWVKNPERPADVRWILHVMTLIQNLLLGL